jgi:Carboxypeptidase regulatory-like domain
VTDAARTISGTVLDATGATVAGARVYLTGAPGPVPDVAALSGADGRFTIAAGRPGVYEIACSTDTQGSAAATVQVGAKGGGVVALRLGKR